MNAGKWYKFSSSLDYTRFKSLCSANAEIADFIIRYKYFKVENIEDNFVVTEISTLGGTTSELINRFGIDADEFRYFTEVDMNWNLYQYYCLTDINGFKLNSSINHRIADKIRGKVFRVIDVDTFFSSPRAKFLEIHNNDGTIEEFRCVLSGREIKYFAKCTKEKVIIEDYCIRSYADDIQYEEKEPFSPIMTVTGKINVVVDDEQSRLFAIKALEGIRFE